MPEYRENLPRELGKIWINKPSDCEGSFLIDYDDVESWGPILSKYITLHTTDQNYSVILREIFRHGSRFLESISSDFSENLYEIVKSWITGNRVIVYHGTRLEEYELEDIINSGLKLRSAHERAIKIVDTIRREVPESVDQDSLYEIVFEETKTYLNQHDRNSIFFFTSLTELKRTGMHYILGGSELNRDIALIILQKFNRSWNDYSLGELFSRSGDSYILASAMPGLEVILASNTQTDDCGSQRNFLREILRKWANYVCPSADFPEFLPPGEMMFTESKCKEGIPIEFYVKCAEFDAE